MEKNDPKPDRLLLEEIKYVFALDVSGKMWCGPMLYLYLYLPTLPENKLALSIRIRGSIFQDYLAGSVDLKDTNDGGPPKGKQ